MGMFFKNVPSGIRAPFAYISLSAGGTPPEERYRLLLIGQVSDDALAVEGEVIQPRNSGVSRLFGANSMLTAMHKAAIDNAPFCRPYCLPMKDSAAGQKATGTLTISGAPVALRGTLALWIDGRRLRVAVGTADNDNAIAASLTEQINKLVGLSVVASVSDNVITLTARHKGSLGNGIEIDLGDIAEEGPLGKQLVTIAPMSGGSGDPDILAALATLGPQRYHWIVMPYDDIVNLDHVQNHLEARWGPTKQIHEHAITVTKKTYGGQATLGAVRNDMHTTIVGAYKYRSSSWETAAALGGRVWHFLSDPKTLSKPLHTIALVGVNGPLKSSDEFEMAERNELYYKGISSLDVQRDGTVAIDRLITTYQVNDWGDPDSTFLSINTVAQAMFGLPYFKQRISMIHKNQAFYDDNSDESLIPIDAATPSRLRISLIHIYTELCQLGVYENPKLFADVVRVEKDQIDPNRANATAALDHVNQLEIFAMETVSYLHRNSVTGRLAA